MQHPVSGIHTVVAGALLLALAGCGGGQGSNSSPAAAPAPAASTLSVNQDTGFGFSFGTYSLRVPGAVYETPIAGTDRAKLTVSPGAQTASTLTINPDGTYVWNSDWDDKVHRGNWQKTGDKDYPFLIKSGEEGKDWKLGKGSGGKGDILLWDGQYMSYVGDRVK